MKQLFILLTALTLACTPVACGDAENQNSTDHSQLSLEESQSESENSTSSQSAPDGAPAAGGENNVLVAYFSATGNTEGIAQYIQAVLDADLYEIVPEDPYTDEDLDYNNDGCRANQEQNDPAARPAISGGVGNLEDYDIVFLRYPIWWGQAPKIIYTFLESDNFGGKTIVPFCTSGSSGIGSSADNLHVLTPDANWLSGQRFSGGADESTVASWVERLDLPGIS